MSSFQHRMLRELKPGWDGYSAKAIDPRCIDRAAVIWGQLSGDWQVVPCADGGVQLEQHRDGLDVEITVSPASALETRTAPPISPWPTTQVFDCHKCAHGQPLAYMLLCPTCGNKRCPKASDHELACTNSNEPGQPGSQF